MTIVAYRTSAEFYEWLCRRSYEPISQVYYFFASTKQFPCQELLVLLHGNGLRIGGIPVMYDPEMDVENKTIDRLFSAKFIR